MMHFEEHGHPENPTLVCVPGLFGGPTDFAAMGAQWSEKFHVISLDPDHEKRKMGVTSLASSDVQSELYRSTTYGIHDLLLRLGKTRAYLVGVSLGSKIVYDFAIKFPEMFAGGVSLDVGPGSFRGTDLYNFIDGLVGGLDLNLPFAEMKIELQRRIPDRNLRSMIQTQLFYPDGKPPARWKSGLGNFSDLLTETLRRQGIEDQFHELRLVDRQLADAGKTIHVLHASMISAIRESHIVSMSTYRSLRVTSVKHSSHFMHVTNKELVSKTVSNMVPETPQRQKQEASPCVLLF